MKQLLAYIMLAAGLIGVFPLAFPVRPAQAQLTILRSIVFPVIGKVSYFDDFADARSGHTHEGNDLMGKKMMPLVAAVDGVVSYVNYPQATWGYSVGIRDSAGWEYNYLHMNNDVPGTDNGLGDGFNAYAPDLARGMPVVKGQLIGWMGDSGNAEGTSPHLHFEIRTPDGAAVSPYQSLQAATHITEPTSAPQLPQEILPYGNFTGGANIAVGNFDKNKKTLEIVTGAGPGGGPHVRILKQDGLPMGGFLAYAANFSGGVDVAAGDVDGDGIDEIITAPGKGGGPHIRIFKIDGTEVKGFFAYDSRFNGGVSVAAADMDGDGKAEIITGPKKGGGPHVRVFKADGTLVSEFFAYDSKFSGGIDVAAIAGTSKNPAAIVTAPGPGGGPHVRIFSSTGLVTGEFLAYDSKFSGGVRVSVANVDTSSSAPEIVTVPASAGGPHVRVFSYSGTEARGSLTGFETWWSGGYDVAAGSGISFIASGFTPAFAADKPGSRRASVREAFASTNNNFFPRGDNGDANTSCGRNSSSRTSRTRCRN